MRVDQRPRRPHRQEGDVRVQHHRRDRRDAAAPRRGRSRPAGPASWSASTASASPALTTLRRHSPAADPRPPQRLGHADRAIRCLGIEFPAYQKLWRLAGVDHMHVNGLRNKFCEPDDSVIASARACLDAAPRRGGVYAGVLLGPVGGPGARDLPARRQRRPDVLCGRRDHGAPGRRRRPGVASVRQAWEAALAGVPLDEYAATHAELRQALERFGA